VGGHGGDRDINTGSNLCDPDFDHYVGIWRPEHSKGGNMEFVGSNKMFLSSELNLEGAVIPTQDPEAGPCLTSIDKKKPGRPKIVAQQPLDVSFTSEIWDHAGKYPNVYGYFFLQFFDHFYGKSRSRLEHALIWERIHGKKVPRNCYIHHRDLNRKNNSAENLMCIPIVLHQELHAQLRIAKKKLCSLAFEVERQRITKEYESKSAEIMEMWEILQGCKRPE